MAYEVTVAFIFSVVFVANRHNLNHMNIGLPVSLLSLANVYRFTKYLFYQWNSDKSAPIKGM